MSSQLKNFLKWASFSLPGHIVLFEIACGIPLMIAFASLSYNDGTLSLSTAIMIFFLGLFAAGVSALFVWYVISAPLIKQRKL